MNNSQTDKNFLESPILREQSTSFDNDLHNFHAELASVFGNIGEPSLYPDETLLSDATNDKNSSTRQERTQSASDREDAKRGLVFGGEADLNLFNAHLRNDEKINPNNFMVEPDSPCWRIKVQEFGDGIVEVVASKQFEKPIKRKKDSGTLSKTRGEMMPEQLELSVQRAKTQMRHKIIMLKCDRMITATYRENMCDRDLAYEHFGKFAKLCNKEFENFEYVAVTEKQKRGAIHFHVAINKYYPVMILNRLWREAIGKREDGLTSGHIHIKKKAVHIQPNSKTKKIITQLARYMCKYMSKDIEGQQIGKKRYSSSRGIPKPDIKTYFIPLGDNTFRLVGDIVMQVTGELIGKPLEFGSVIWWSSYT